MAATKRSINFASNIGDVPGLINNYSAAGAPGVTDDAAHGYGVGSIWTTTGNAVYMCTDATTGAAHWTTLG